MERLQLSASDGAVCLVAAAARAALPRALWNFTGQNLVPRAADGGRWSLGMARSGVVKPVILGWTLSKLKEVNLNNLKLT